ncbi:hypothetical protein [Hyphomicrobium sp.]|uniref:hypothetical protein n=1 Tax=Hyphomicrobium sp. TaxID=82 RepID=UPI002E32BE89|nr:hypothetical protein [Hyphomicrobium sp.]HEX2840006.1 hypothetical protein [Hyphomicrobium sp.]
MQGVTRAAGLGLAALLVGFSPARASGNFLCEIDDQALKFSVESTFSHGLGEVFTDFRGHLSVALKDAPEDFTSIEIGAEQLSHHWFAGPDLKLHIYKERIADAPHGYVELIVETRQSKDDETSYSGAYKLTVFDVGKSSTTEGRTLKAEGNVSCSVG